MSTSSNIKVEYKQLGNSGLRVSVPILGTMGMGDPKWGGWPVGKDESLPILKKAWDAGITTWDTADMYSNGLSESIIGEAIAKYQIPRENLVIMTKAFHIIHKDTGTPAFLIPGIGDSRDYVNQHGLSRGALFHAVDASLKRLGTTYIDLFQIHRFDHKTPPEETMRALHDLVTSGKVRYIGASSMWTWQFQMLNHVAELNGWTKFVSMQNNYSLLYREEEREMNAYCKHAGIGIIPYGPLSDGYLARPIGTMTTRQEVRKGSPWERRLTETDKEIIKRVQELAVKKNVKMAQIALAWIQTKCTSPIVGVNKVERVDEAIVSSDILTVEDIKYLEEPYVPQTIKGHF